MPGILSSGLEEGQGFLLGDRPCNLDAKPCTRHCAYERADDCAYRRSYFGSHGVTYY